MFVHVNMDKLKLLGDVVVRTSGETIKLEKLLGEDRVLGLYFSAHWCAPCRAFTPELKTFYENFKKSSRSNLFDVIFVSSDENEESFNEGFKEMPWFAIPFVESARSRQLSKSLRVKNIPTLILLDAVTGKVITRHARHHVTDDPNAAEFPWRPRSLATVLADGQLVDAAGRVHRADQLDGGIIKALYFSANWCPPCKAFTPKLVLTYDHLRRKGTKMEVIFVSSDRSRESFDQYFGTMPWLAVPFDEQKRRKELAYLLGVQGIPKLIILDERNNILTCDGRYEIIEDPEGENFPWRPRLVEDLTEKFSSRLHEDPFLVLFTDGNDKELEQARQMLIPAASELSLPGKENALWFFVGGETEICDRLREFAQLEDEVPLLVILDMVNREKYVLEDDVELDTDVVRGFVNQYLDGSLLSRPLDGSLLSRPLDALHTYPL